jgi:hypothetical protein
MPLGWRGPSMLRLLSPVRQLSPSECEVRRNLTSPQAVLSKEVKVGRPRDGDPANIFQVVPPSLRFSTAGAL